MEPLLNEFTVHRPIAHTWAVLTDVERIAPCMKGARTAGDRGRDVPRCRQAQAGADLHPVQGPGTLRRARRPQPSRGAEGRGSRHRRQGQRRSDDHRLAAVGLGRRHQGARGVGHQAHRQGRPVRPPRRHSRHQREADDRLRRTTSTPCSMPKRTRLLRRWPRPLPLARTLARASRHRSPRATEGATDVGSTAATGETEAPAAAPTVRKIQGPAAEPIELSDVAGAAVLKRLLPLFGGLALLLLILRRLRK